MKVGEVKITAKEYESLIRGNEHLITQHERVINLIMNKHIDSRKRGYSGIVSCEDIADIFNITLPIIKKDEGESVD